jgi:hypothetical protein
MAIPTILSGAAGRALRTLTPLSTTNTQGLDALVLVNRALPDMVSALGDDAGKALGKRLFDASRSGSTRTATSREQVRIGLDELQSAASSTATKRVVIGSLAVGGALAGLLALRGAGSGGDSQPMAPGPIGEDRAPTGISV